MNRIPIYFYGKQKKSLCIIKLYFQPNLNYKDIEQMYQLRGLVETPVSSYKDNAYLSESPIYQNAESVNSERNKETAPIYSAISYISRSTNNQGNIIIH